MEKIELAIIGAGPSGIFTAFEAGMLDIKSHIFDASEEAGGQCKALYPTKPIYDIAGFPEISAGELIDNLVKQAEPFEPVYHLRETVTNVVKQQDGSFLLKTSKENKFHAKAVVIACGMGCFQHNKPDIVNLEKFENGKGIVYSIKDPEIYRDKKVVIAGGGNSAVDWALILKDVAKEVTIFHRGNLDSFKASPDNINKLKESARNNELTILENCELQSLDGNELLKSITLTSTSVDNQETETIECDNLAIFFGLKTNLVIVKQWGIDFNNRGLIDVDRLTMQTNIPGIFAVGDIAYYDAKHRLIATEFGEGITAAYKAYEYIYPDKKAIRPHSTSIGKTKNLGNKR